MSEEDDEVRKAPQVPPDSELLQLIFESATDFAIFTMDPNGVTTSWNTGAERLFGYREQEIVGRSADVIFPPEPDGLNAAADERRHALAHGRASDERWQKRKDCSLFWSSGLLMPLADRTAGFVKIARDRTAQHRAEQQLRASEDLFRTLATNVPELVFRSRADGYRTWASPQWSIFTGSEFADSVGFGWLDAVHPEDRGLTRDAWAKAPPNKQFYVEHRIHRSADGEYRWHQTRAAPLPGGDPEAVEWVGASADIHDLRSLQDRQRVLLAELQHRSRNLIAVVQSIAHQTIRSRGSLQQFADEYGARLRALARVQGLLSRANYGPIDLRELVDMELEAHRYDEAEPDKVTVEGPPVSLPAVSAQMLALALHELATNAVKYGALRDRAGKLEIRWRIHDAGEGGERRTHIEWLESGVQMPAGDARRKGYGSELIERALPYQLGAETKLEFGADGTRCEIAVTTDA
ncbi:MAG TPA: PAS domain S-box protein [Roseiarcus sp.]|nr:PAS domain S-box protein [Roseiarcus sp.]